MVEIIIIEPHALLRLGVLQVLANMEPHYKIEGTDYSALSEQAPVSPEIDLAVLSVSAAESPLDMINATKRIYSPKWILLLSGSGLATHNVLDFPSIVAGYIRKHVSPEVLVASIRLILAGGKCFPLPLSFDMTASPTLLSVPTISPLITLPTLLAGHVHQASYSSRAIGHSVGPLAMSDEKPSSVAVSAEAKMLNLTPRQYEVLVLLAKGYPMKMVGRQLNISTATAKTHAETVYMRLAVHNRSEAVHTAIARGAFLGWERSNPVHVNNAGV
jgi:two-component system nitrate/nitrite response regulator NarL